MASTPSIGETRASSPPSDAPAPKKPRLEAPDVPKSTAAKQPKQSKSQKRRQQYSALPEPCSADDVLWREINDVLGADYVKTALAEGTDRQSPFEYHQELEMRVVALCSSGVALATSAEASRPWVVVVPFCLPGETVRVRVYRNARMHSLADLIAVVTPNPEMRDDSLVRCKYFTSCGGCQYQMLPYEKQLDLKRDVVVKAYKNFSDLPSSSVPSIEPTMPSPLQYNYRTKITPHFEAPTKAQRADPANPQNDSEQPSWFKIGFNQVGTHKVMDIEDCPIATPVIREALPAVRANAVKNLYTYKRGVSLILRDSLPVPPASAADGSTQGPAADADALATALDETHICITDHRGTVRERVGGWLFEYPASSFFQNNNAVLPGLVEYVRERIFANPNPSPNPPPTPTHLVDAYCGAGLFAIALSPHFTNIAGIELSAPSIAAATRNAALNAIPATKISFRAGDAADIFKAVSEFPRRETVVVIDPPRKGCDGPFIEQLLGFGAGRVVYVSCNVHTQARDVGDILRKSGQGGKGRYVLESVRGFDLFPQTAHVESVAVLRLLEAEGEGGEGGEVVMGGVGQKEKEGNV
ncbi:S-adenosyl-L-methionine-dependent methyltransferase [Mycena rosella]|uniref:S-adenosyl-L-methionine-dependent methyltransferase n=1 Tax=Mycena rosella TaxID=1033263 RepID=A0AAD7CRY4_MYCRO|nr:S-adenosyl-L-methionine-dependent methyltransferase [Mycena rosella]